jgi:ABC-type branched-subunit amino acid transport system substrate-binding protein
MKAIIFMIFMIAMIAVCVNAAKSDNVIKIGVLFPYAYSEAPAAAALAAYEINKNPNILPDHTIEVYFADSGIVTTDNKPSLKAMENFMAQNVTMTLGPDYGTMVESLIDLVGANNYNMVFLNSVVQDILLGDRATYPQFARTVYSDDVFLDATVNIVQYYGWKQLAILTSDATESYLSAQTFSASCQAAGITVLTIVTFASSPVPNITLQMQSIVNSGARIIFLSFSNIELPYVLPQMEKFGLTGAPYQFLLADSISNIPTTLALAINNTVLNGAIGVGGNGGVLATNPAYQNFTKRWNAYKALDPVAMFEASVVTVAVPFYDLAYIAAMAYNNMLYVPKFAGMSLYESLLGTTYQGVVRWYQFQSNGNILGNVNMINVRSTYIAVTTDVPGVVINNGTNSALNVTSNVIWTGGVTHVPSDSASHYYEMQQLPANLDIQMIILGWVIVSITIWVGMFLTEQIKQKKSASGDGTGSEKTYNTKVMSVHSSTDATSSRSASSKGLMKFLFPKNGRIYKVYDYIFTARNWHWCILAAFCIEIGIWSIIILITSSITVGVYDSFTIHVGFVVMALFLGAFAIFLSLMNLLTFHHRGKRINIVERFTIMHVQSSQSVPTGKEDERGFFVHKQVLEIKNASKLQESVINSDKSTSNGNGHTKGKMNSPRSEEEKTKTEGQEVIDIPVRSDAGGGGSGSDNTKSTNYNFNLEDYWYRMTRNWLCYMVSSLLIVFAVKLNYVLIITSVNLKTSIDLNYPIMIISGFILFFVCFLLMDFIFNCIQFYIRSFVSITIGSIVCFVTWFDFNNQTYFFMNEIVLYSSSTYPNISTMKLVVFVVAAFTCFFAMGLCAIKLRISTAHYKEGIVKLNTKVRKLTGIKQSLTHEVSVKTSMVNKIFYKANTNANLFKSAIQTMWTIMFNPKSIEYAYNRLITLNDNNATLNINTEKISSHARIQTSHLGSSTLGTPNNNGGGTVVSVASGTNNTNNTTVTKKYSPLLGAKQLSNPANLTNSTQDQVFEQAVSNINLVYPSLMYKVETGGLHAIFTDIKNLFNTPADQLVKQINASVCLENIFAVTLLTREATRLHCPESLNAWHAIKRWKNLPATERGGDYLEEFMKEYIYDGGDSVINISYTEKQKIINNYKSGKSKSELFNSIEPELVKLINDNIVTRILADRSQACAELIFLLEMHKKLDLVPTLDINAKEYGIKEVEPEIMSQLGSSMQTAIYNARNSVDGKLDKLDHEYNGSNDIQDIDEYDNDANDVNID